MKSIVSFAFLSCAALLVTASGCSGEALQSSPATEESALTLGGPVEQGQQLNAEDEALASDNMDLEEVDAADDDLESGLANTENEDELTDVADVDAIDALVRTNPGKVFTPAGCLQSTRQGKGKWRHVLNDCEGPKGRFTFSGTVTAKWSLRNGVLKVARAAEDLVITGKRVVVKGAGTKSVSFKRAESVVTRHRIGDFTGTIARKNEAARGLPFTHHADFTTTWNRITKEFTRDGSAECMVGRKSLERTVSDYKATGSRRACPTAGEVVIVRERRGTDHKLTINFLGGQDVKITGSRGRSITRTTECGE